MARIEDYNGHSWKNGDYPDMSAENLQSIDDAVVNTVKACNDHDGNINELLKPTYTGSDTTDDEANGWTTIEPLTSGESHKSMLAKASQMFKNVRYLWKLLGNTDISKIGGGTVTGAVSQLNTALADAKKSIDVLNSEAQKMAQNLEKSFVFKESINWQTSYTYKFPSGINSVMMLIIGGLQNQHNCLVFGVRVNEMLRYKKFGAEDTVTITQSADQADLIIKAPVTILIKIFESHS